MQTPIVLSIQVGMPDEHGPDVISKKSWQSGIFKYPVEGRIWLDTLNLAGDGQQDLHNHGGPFRALLTYSAEHYPTWRDELARPEFPYGAFGENLTVTQLDETSVYLGDIYAVGEALVQVTQPRMPCWKLARRWEIKDLTARVDAHQWGGWYQRVLKPGYIEAGDTYQRVEMGNPRYPIQRLYTLGAEREGSQEAFAELSQSEVLTPSWREWFAKKLG
ncbi:MAG: MOSC domain-containing protein [Chloroflexota bacterium]|nr:MOSC domain-containing protein [Chloroflexota bacterium]